MASAADGCAASSAAAFATAPSQSRPLSFGSQKRSRIVRSISWRTPGGGCAGAAPRSASAKTRSAASGFRMRIPIHLGELRRVQVRVLLRRRERGMAEQLLDRAEIRAGLEQVRRERVTEGVRRDLFRKPRGPEAPLEQARPRARRQTSPARGDEKRLALAERLASAGTLLRPVAQGVA